MKTTSVKFLAVLAAVAALSAAPLEAQARPVGGAGGPGYAHAGGGWNHGGYYGGYRGGWGYRGWGPGYYWGGIGLGLGLASIAYASGPYYGYDSYYAYPGYVAPVSEYVVVEPTQGDRVVRSGGQPVPSTRAPDPIFYPKGGQTAGKTESDRQECNRWATTQSGAMNDASIFQRATYACMEGRGYVVK